MPVRKKKPARKPIEEYTEIAVRVDIYEVRATASINHHLLSPECVYMLGEDEPVYQFDTHLEIFGTAIAPGSRAGDEYHLSLLGDGAPSSHLKRTLKSMQEREEDHSLRYRTYRGRKVPVYKELPGLAMINKLRGEPRWKVWVPALPRFVSDTLILLGQDKQVYFTLYERKIARRRWLRYLTIQTVDPREDA